MKPILTAVLALPLLLLPAAAMAGEMSTVTPELALPEPEAVSTPLPHSTVTEQEGMSMIETELGRPGRHGCGSKETVYLTN